ncbi:cytochrome P450 [Chlamydoabsidia padenii]|nr:cytochrome P450 [Chlamydoabsidia padenii]
MNRPAFRQALIRYIVRLTLVYIASKYFIYRLLLHPANQLPGPPPDYLMPFLGNIRQLLSKDAGVTHREWANKYGNVFRYFAGGNHPRILIADPTLVKHILNNEKDFINPHKPKSCLLDNGALFLQDGVHWYQRRMLDPAFSISVVRGILPTIILPTQQLIDQWGKQASTSSLPTEIIVSNGLQLLSLDIIGMAGFGQRFDCLSHPLGQAHLDLLAGNSPMESLFARQDWTALKNQFKRMIQKSGQRDDLLDKKDLLALMMQHEDDDSGKTLTPTELQDQCLSFLAAGYETTSVVGSWCLHTLAHHQDIQDELRHQVRQVFSTDLDEYDAINQLPLLNNVCKESLRFTPPVPITHRTATKEFDLRDKRFPKGTRVVICPMVSHFDKQQWGDDCNEFIPSRWDHAPANTIDPYVYLPFLAGDRQCIGYEFALMEFKLILALLIKHFKFTPKPGFNVRMGMQTTLRPLPNMTLMVQRIDP